MPHYTTQQSAGRGFAGLTGAADAGGAHADEGFGGYNRHAMKYAVRPVQSMRLRTKRTWDGVFLPVSLSIFGVVLFLRLPWIIGQCGFWLTILGIFLCFGVTLLTTISLAAISTNGIAGDGGPYMMISRCLGPQVGTTVGITFVLANLVASAMYLNGGVTVVVHVFDSAKLVDYYHDNQYGVTVLCSSLMLATLLCTTFFRVEKFFRLGCLVLTLLSVIDVIIYISRRGPVDPISATNAGGYLGLSSAAWRRNWDPDFTDGNNFQTALSILFPGVSGVMSGVCLSGDLRNGAKAMPRGIAYAWLLSLITYVVITALVAASFDRDLLRTNFRALRSASDPAVFLPGEFCAAFAAVLAMMIGSATVLRAIARDELLPWKWVRVIGRTTQRRAVICFWALIQLLLFTGDTYTYASAFATQVFCANFLALNLSTFLSAATGMPSFRPLYSVFNVFTAAAGAIVCLGLMFFINPLFAAIVLLLMMMLLFFIDAYIDPTKVTWGDASQPLVFYVVRKWLLRLDERKEHIRHWRPSIMHLMTDPLCSMNLMHLTNNLKKGGLYELGIVLGGDFHTTGAAAFRWKGWLMDFIGASGIKAFGVVTFGATLRDAAQQMLRTCGLGGMRPNTVLISMDELLQKDAFRQVYEAYQRACDADALGSEHFRGVVADFGAVRPLRDVSKNSSVKDMRRLRRSGGGGAAAAAADNDSDDDGAKHASSGSDDDDSDDGACHAKRCVPAPGGARLSVQVADDTSARSMPERASTSAAVAVETTHLLNRRLSTCSDGGGAGGRRRTNSDRPSSLRPTTGQGRNWRGLVLSASPGNTLAMTQTVVFNSSSEGEEDDENGENNEQKSPKGSKGSPPRRDGYESDSGDEDDAGEGDALAGATRRREQRKKKAPKHPAGAAAPAAAAAAAPPKRPRVHIRDPCEDASGRGASTRASAPVGASMQRRTLSAWDDWMRKSMRGESVSAVLQQHNGSTTAAGGSSSSVPSTVAAAATGATISGRSLRAASAFEGTAAVALESQARVERRLKAAAAARRATRWGLFRTGRAEADEEVEHRLLEKMIAQRHLAKLTGDVDLSTFSGIDEFCAIARDVCSVNMNLLIARNMDKLDTDAVRSLPRGEKVYIDVWFAREDDPIIHLMAYCVSKTSVWRKFAVVRLVSVVTLRDEVEQQMAELRSFIKSHRLPAIPVVVTLEEALANGIHYSSGGSSTGGGASSAGSPMSPPPPLSSTTHLPAKNGPHESSSGDDLAAAEAAELHADALERLMEEESTRAEAVNTVMRWEFERNAHRTALVLMRVDSCPPRAESDPRLAEEWFGSLAAMTAHLPPVLMLTGGNARAIGNDW